MWVPMKQDMQGNSFYEVRLPLKSALTGKNMAKDRLMQSLLSSEKNDTSNAREFFAALHCMSREGISSDWPQEMLSSTLSLCE